MKRDGLSVDNGDVDHGYMGFFIAVELRLEWASNLPEGLLNADFWAPPPRLSFSRSESSTRSHTYKDHPGDSDASASKQHSE